MPHIIQKVYHTHAQINASLVLESAHSPADRAAMHSKYYVTWNQWLKCKTANKQN